MPANDGTSEELASPFTLTKVNQWLNDPSLTDLTVHFIPSANQPSESVEDSAYHFVVGLSSGTERLSISSGPNPRKIRLVGDLRYGKRPVLRAGKTTWASTWLNGSTYHDWLIQTKPNGLNAEEIQAYLEYIEVRDLVLDGDFDNQGAYSSAANADGYKNVALYLGARTGLIQNVLVRRFGSTGQVPVTYFHGAGSETFPVSVWTRDGDKVEPPTASNDWSDPNRPYPWLIQDVEVSDFRSRHGGYGTMIMPVVKDTTIPASGATPLPLMAVRKCRVHGNSSVIALGTAGTTESIGSDRILYEDNIILNAGIGLNTDTYSMSWLTFRRNAFLDVIGGFILGQPGVHVLGSPNHHHYTIENNLLRLRGRGNIPNYRNWDETATGVDASDPNLALGRLVKTYAYCVLLNGRAGDIVFQNNRITTWPLNGAQNWFVLPTPGSVPTPEFRVVWSLPPNTFIDSYIDHRDRYPSSAVTLANCHVSAVAMEFGSGMIADPLTGASLLAATSGASGHYAGSFSPGYQNLRTPPPMATTGGGQYVFVPQGRIERVQVEYDAADHLESVWEVVPGVCNFASGTLTGTARLMKHGLPGTSSVGTATPEEHGVRVSVELVADGETVASPQSIYNAATFMTSSTGVLNLNVGVVPNPGKSIPGNGVVIARIWYDKQETSGPGALEADRHAWSRLEIPYGTVVDILALPDVADDKNTASAKRAKFRIRRNPGSGGTWSGLGSLAVKVQLIDSGVLRPGDNVNLNATYGTGSTADYYLTGGGWPGGAVPMNVAQTVTIPAGQEFVELTVVPVADNKTEANVVTLQVVPPGDNTYAVGLTDKAEVLIYDGPEWTVYELGISGANYLTQSSAAYAINELDGTTQPKVAGFMTYRYYYSGAPPTGLYYEYSVGGYWSLPGLGFNQLDSVVYGSISTSPLRLVGTSGIYAQVKPVPGAAFNLPHFTTGPSTARGINRAGTVITGTSLNTTSYATRPVVWQDGFSVAKDIGVAGQSSWSGLATAANNNRQVVGQFHAEFTGGDAGEFAFRTKKPPTGGPNEVQRIEFVASDGTVGDVLHSIGKSGVQSLDAEATAITSDGRVVGWSNVNGQTWRATYWSAGTPSGALVAVDMGAWKSPSGSNSDSDSKGNGINDSAWIVGWSGSRSGGVLTTNRAVLKRAPTIYQTDWLDLNDRFLVHGLGGWQLKSAEAVSGPQAGASAYIVGTGLLYGSPRGFVLIPRSLGN